LTPFPFVTVQPVFVVSDMLMDREMKINFVNVSESIAPGLLQTYFEIPRLAEI
jgi:hypothetical protein